MWIRRIHMTEEYFGTRFPVAIDMLTINWGSFDQEAFVGFTGALLKCWGIGDMGPAFEGVHGGRWNVDAGPCFLGCGAFKVILHSDVSWWSLKISWAVFISSPRPATRSTCTWCRLWTFWFYSIPDRSQKSQEISTRRSSNEVRTLRGRESCFHPCDSTLPNSYNPRRRLMTSRQ